MWKGWPARGKAGSKRPSPAVEIRVRGTKKAAPDRIKSAVGKGRSVQRRSGPGAVSGKRRPWTCQPFVAKVSRVPRIARTRPAVTRTIPARVMA